MKEEKIKSVQVVLGFSARFVSEVSAEEASVPRRLPQCAPAATAAAAAARYLLMPVLRQLPLRKRKIVRELSQTCFLIFRKDEGERDASFTFLPLEKNHSILR